MALQSNRFIDNISGKYYVDDDCIFCNLCDELAPTIFRASDEGDHNIVFHQPESDDEAECAEEALDSCPVSAIGNDGDSKA